MWEQTERIFLDSLARVLDAVARVLPGLLAMFFVVLLAVALATVLHLVVLRLGERLNLDRWLAERGMASAPGQPGPSRQLARLVAGTVLAIGVLAGLGAVDAAATTALAIHLVDVVPRVVVAAVILAIGFSGSRAVERSVLIGGVNMGIHSARLLGLGARWLVVVLAVAIALEHVGVGRRVVPVALGILFGGIVLALALAVGLGARDLVARSLSKRFPSGPHPVEPPPDDEDRIQHL